MKMTQEEKARAYDEAVKVIKDNLDALNEIIETGAEIVNIQSIKNCFYRAFPELKESKDDRIRKLCEELIRTCFINELCTKEEKDDCIAWLEKQVSPQMVADAYLRGCNDIEKKLLEKQSEKPQGKSELEAIKEELVDNANKVELKFKVGDFIANDYCRGKIVKITDDAYLLDTGQGIPFSCEHNAHLWTIADAKDGDVVAFYGEYRGNKMVQVGIIEKYVGKHGGCSNTFKIYVGVNWDNNLQIGEYMGCSDIRPATKEQRDLLFQKMHEDGYEWDAEKKELKKIEDEEYDGEDYGIDSLWHAKNILEKTLGKVDGYQTDDGILEHKCAISIVDKLYKQKPAEFSEEDEEALEMAIISLEDMYDVDEPNTTYAGHYMAFDKAANLLKSLKQRLGCEE